MPWVQPNNVFGASFFVGNVMMAGTNASPPVPDTVLHVWKGSAGAVAANANAAITIEDDATVYLQFLTPNTSSSGFLFGDVDNAIVGQLTYAHTTNTLNIDINGVYQLAYTDGTLTFQKATVFASTAGNLTLSPAANTVIGSVITIDPTATAITNTSNIFITSTAVSLADGAGSTWRAFRVDGNTVTLAGTTQITTELRKVDLGQMSITQTGGAVTVDTISTLQVQASRPNNASVTLTDVAAIHVVASSAPTGTLTRLHGILIDALTQGTNNSQITLVTGVTAPAVFTDHVKLFATDITGGDARFGIVSESGSVIYLGNDRLRYAAATGILGIGATDVLTMTASLVSLVASGKIAAASGVVGYSVVSTAYTLGTGGTVILPNVNMSGAANDAARDALAGNINGAIAIDTGVTGRVYIRDAGTWKFALFA